MGATFNFALDEEEESNTYCIIVNEDALFIRENAGMVHIPTVAEIKRLQFDPDQVQYLGRLAEKACFAANISKANLPELLPTSYSFIKIRQLFGILDSESYRFALRAAHIVTWRNNNQYCGRCASEMDNVAQELAMKCTACGYVVYPRISPAIIVAIIKGSEILLARSNRFPPGRYSVIAGFLEPGETLEDCVRREVKEEVGIEVDTITYFGNQPWPFPDSQMIGFTARYAGGEITIDNNEIVAADWFTVDKFPDIPPKDSIARRLIDSFVDNIRHTRSPGTASL